VLKSLKQRIVVHYVAKIAHKDVTMLRTVFFLALLKRPVDTNLYNSNNNTLQVCKRGSLCNQLIMMGALQWVVVELCPSGSQPKCKDVDV